MQLPDQNKTNSVEWLLHEQQKPFEDKSRKLIPGVNYTRDNEFIWL